MKRPIIITARQPRPPRRHAPVHVEPRAIVVVDYLDRIPSPEPASSEQLAKTFNDLRDLFEVDFEI